MSFRHELRKHFGTANPYQVLGTTNDASADAIKSAYKRAALRYHPDQNANDETATIKFQLMSRCHQLLSGTASRGRYDRTGDMDGGDSPLDDWVAHWGRCFTTEDIDDFKSRYRFGVEERADVAQAYRKYNGNMDLILESVILSDWEDETRFREMLQEMIDAGELPSYDLFANEPPAKKAKRKRRAEREAQRFRNVEAGRSVKSGQAAVAAGDNVADLQAAIAERAKERAGKNFLGNLEAKYSHLAAKRGGGNGEDDGDDSTDADTIGDEDEEESSDEDDSDTPASTSPATEKSSGKGDSRTAQKAVPSEPVAGPSSRVIRPPKRQNHEDRMASETTAAGRSLTAVGRDDQRKSEPKRVAVDGHRTPARTYYTRKAKTEAKASDMHESRQKRRRRR